MISVPAILAITSGVLLALSFPPINLWLLTWVALLPLLFAINKKGLFQSFALGWVTGFVMFIGQIFWLKIFHLSIPFVLSGYLALYLGFFCVLYKIRFFRNYCGNLLGFSNPQC